MARIKVSWHIFAPCNLLYSIIAITETTSLPLQATVMRRDYINHSKDVVKSGEFFLELKSIEASFSFGHNKKQNTTIDDQIKSNNYKTVPDETSTVRDKERKVNLKFNF
jgi:hypothetical protein